MPSWIILSTLLIVCSVASQERRCKNAGNWYACNKVKDGTVECEVRANWTDQSPMVTSSVPAENVEDSPFSFQYRCLRQFNYLKFSFEFCSTDSHVRVFKELPKSGKPSSWYECHQEDGSMVCKVHLSPYSSNGIHSTITERDWYQCFQNGPQVDCFIRPFQHLDQENCGAVKRGCRPGASKNIKGYWCMCGYDGLTYQCPLKRIMNDFKGCQSERCAIGSVWREGKFICTCSEDFVPLCHVSEETLTRDANYNCPQKSRICNPGEVFQYKSKTCTCQETGMFAVCKKSNTTIMDSGKKPHICLADNRFIQGEKDCLCLDDSRSGLCVSTKPVGLTCSPDRLYMDDCNLCLCSSDGRSALCTVRHCADGEQPVKRRTNSHLGEENFETGVSDFFQRPVTGSELINDVSL